MLCTRALPLGVALSAVAPVDPASWIDIPGSLLAAVNLTNVEVAR
jgi:hypothetical protein